MMAMKCIKKLRLVIVELVILIIIELHGSDPTHFSYNPVPVPTSLDAFQIDHTYNQLCLESTVEKCEKIQNLIALEKCVIRNLFSCLFKHPIHQKIPLRERITIHQKCIIECFGRLRGIRGAQCLLDCYEGKMNKH
jgi:hypothetical protein